MHSALCARPRWRSPLLLLVALLASVSVVASSGTAARAEPFTPSRYGPRIGFSVTPDQFVVGAFLGFPDFRPGFRARPSVDVGFGDDRFSLILNGDLQYDFTESSLKPIPFVGAGLGLGYYNFDSQAGNESSVDVGAQVYGGVEIDLGAYRTALVEIRLGFSEMPDFKLVVGMGFF